MRHNNGYGISLRRWACGALLAFLSLSASAGNVVSRSEFDAYRALRNSAGQYTVGMGTNGAPLVTSGVPGAGAVGNMNISHTAGGWPGASGTASMPSPLAGKSVPLSVRQPLTKAATAKALTNFAKKAFWPLAAGVAVYDLIQELGYEVADNGDGTRRVYQTQTSYSCAGADYQTPIYAADGAVTSTQYCVPASAGSTQMKFGWSHQSGSYGWPGLTFPCGNYTCKTGYVDQAVGTIAGSAQTTETPKTWEQFESDIAAQSGWPSGSAISSALAQAINGGEAVDTNGPVEITSGGVASVDKTNVVQSSDGSSVEDKTECSWAADLFGVVSWECVTVVKTTTPEKTTTETVVTTKPDGTTETSVITKSSPSTSVTVTTTPDGAPSERLSLDTPSGDLPRRTETISWNPIDLGFGGGACPAPFTWSDSLGSHSLNLQSYCDVVTSIVRPLVLAFALLAAYFIVAGVRME